VCGLKNKLKITPNAQGTNWKWGNPGKPTKIRKNKNTRKN